MRLEGATMGTAQQWSAKLMASAAGAHEEPSDDDLIKVRFHIFYLAFSRIAFTSHAQQTGQAISLLAASELCLLVSVQPGCQTGCY